MLEIVTQVNELLNYMLNHISLFRPSGDYLNTHTKKKKNDYIHKEFLKSTQDLQITLISA